MLNAFKIKTCKQTKPVTLCMIEKGLGTLFGYYL